MWVRCTWSRRTRRDENGPFHRLGLIVYANPSFSLLSFSIPSSFDLSFRSGLIPYHVDTLFIPRKEHNREQRCARKSVNQNSNACLCNPSQFVSQLPSGPCICICIVLVIQYRTVATILRNRRELATNRLVNSWSAVPGPGFRGVSPGHPAQVSYFPLEKIPSVNPSHATNEPLIHVSGPQKV
jgi:hypothetical protein